MTEVHFTPCTEVLLRGHFHAKSGVKKSNGELGANSCCIRFFDVERDSLMARASHDRESAYMLGLTWTSVPIPWLNHSEWGSRKNHNCTQTWVTDRESVLFLFYNHNWSNKAVKRNESCDTALLILTTESCETATQVVWKLRKSKALIWFGEMEDS